MNRIGKQRRNLNVIEPAKGVLRWLLLPTAVAVVIATTLPARPGQAFRPVSGPASEWAADLRKVDQALAADQIGTAIRSWELARAAARASRHWEGLLAAGDAYLRIGDAVELRRAFVATARATYLEALERARHSASAEGALGVAIALAALDDHPGIERAAAIACAAAVSRQRHGGQETRRACERVVPSPWKAPRIDARGDAS